MKLSKNNLTHKRSREHVETNQIEATLLRQESQHPLSANQVTAEIERCINPGSQPKEVHYIFYT